MRASRIMPLLLILCSFLLTAEIHAATTPAKPKPTAKTQSKVKAKTPAKTQLPAQSKINTTRFEFIYTDPSWEKVMAMYQQVLTPNSVALQYASLIVKDPDWLVDNLKRWDCDQDVLYSVGNHKGDITKFLRMVTLSGMAGNNIDDAQLIQTIQYVTNGHVLSRDASDYAAEEQYMSIMPAYAYYKRFQEDGLKNMVEKMFFDAEKLRDGQSQGQ